MNHHFIFFLGQFHVHFLHNIDKHAFSFSETFYFFGDNDIEEWSDLLSEYNLPPLNLPHHSAALSFGLAGPGTGVPFHFHGPGKCGICLLFNTIDNCKTALGIQSNQFLKAS